MLLDADDRKRLLPFEPPLPEVVSHRPPREAHPTLASIRNLQCHMPLDELDPESGLTRYCGAPVPADSARPYCPSCRARMYVAEAPRPLRPLKSRLASEQVPQPTGWQAFFAES